VSFSWAQADVISRHVQKIDGLGDTRREQCATLILLAAASGLRSSVLLALRANDVDFQAGTVRVDESSDQRTKGRIGLCKNTRAYRTVVLHDVEGRKAMQALGRFMGSSLPDELIFHSRRKGPL
jgi:integrase